VDGDWFRSRNDPIDRRSETIDRLTQELQTALNQILKPEQLDRLFQLQCQALGTRMVLRDDIAEKLNVTEDQKALFVEMAIETDREVATVNKQVREGKLDAGAGGRKIAELQKSERERFVTLLTPQQSESLPSMTGKTFDFGKIKRIYPMAPELQFAGATWIQGGPLQIADLRGKVVAVHFYAFQCINCQRNLPHYQAWHTDYADQGLVVIGIQTPELSAERSPDLVKAAAVKEGMEYPLVLDLKASNWKAWHNTMWPTVYLIDKKGFLRRWWQGEMNWQGTPGEKQMRETLEMLLKE
jgi:peroxiredoxin